MWSAGQNARRAGGESQVKRVRLALVGLGNVGRRFLRLLLESDDTLSRLLKFDSGAVISVSKGVVLLIPCFAPSPVRHIVKRIETFSAH